MEGVPHNHMRGEKIKKMVQGFSKINKGEVNMVKKGMGKPDKGTLVGAYAHEPQMMARKRDYAMSAATYPMKKLLGDNRALSYSRTASMKTRK